MSPMQMHLFIVGIPLLLVIVLSVLIWSHKGPHPATYKLGEKWTHPPILWAAVDEDVGHAGHGGHGTSEFTVGGGASGTW
ncbi:hypothetical protein O979_08380 [Mycobacterium avium subsp. paratuberculosis 10-4404]|uniref:Uncharacterized protein n=6 Tax=Mycobacterium avium complex (MAC) TaxID=120793 RepID=Q73XM0_MYCPA|nr:hypothetical protein MAP_2289c [Mycobacterium avium subsp. paratuberculosis K-10]AGL36463.1 hypothetical protein MAP4_1535 [Mycobacterium avium subsp. paratuberculosis MAP4]ETA93245.1 hypothetical protein O984_09705 [Mycobacterium avium 05-4293]ETA98935.1 hypothetical protein O982_08480 [Mycobacterium avium 10-5581]ETB03791.1 hypothetical protein O979_08380 [Mycobacterium avium subsp. paratuberculosis 10-4404]ETB05247.1 hypothetical protein O978_08425 [Mycobacterium avium subsp. paratubercu